MKCPFKRKRKRREKRDLTLKEFEELKNINNTDYPSKDVIRMI